MNAYNLTHAVVGQEMEKELVISAKEYVRYETELMDDFIEFLSGKEMLRENSSASLVSPE